MDMARMFAAKPREGARDALPVLTLAALLVLSAANAMAQTSVVTPRLDTSLTWTDNASSSGIGGFGGLGGSAGNGGEDWILEVSPGISVARDRGRLSGTFSASFRNLTYANNTDNNTSYLALNGGGQFEAIEDMFFIDADASISRGNASTFSTRGLDDPLDVNADNERRVFTLSPRFQFRIGDNTEGALRYQRRWSNSGNAQLSDQDKDQWSAEVSNTQITGIFGLGLEYNRQNGGYSGGSLAGASNRGSQEQEETRVTLYAKVSPSFRLRGIVGHEKNDYDDGLSNSETITGGGFDWNPTERTEIVGTVENRIFGTGYDFTAQHRLARAVLMANFSRDIDSPLDVLAGGGLSDPLYASIYEDILRRNPGISPVAASDEALMQLRQMRGGVLTNAYFLTRSARLGLGYALRRGALALTFARIDRTRLGSASGLAEEDDFRNFESISSDVVSLSFSHRLTPQTSLDTSVSRANSEGRGEESADTQRTSFQIGLSSSLGPNTRGALTYRHQRSDGDNNSLGDSNRKENAVTATVGMNF